MGKSNWSETIKKADLFSREIEILFENGKSKLQTHCGVVFGAVMVCILVLYGVWKGQIMVEYLDNTIQEPTMKNYFDASYTYDNRHGWQVAFGLTAYDKNSDQTPFDDSFGKLKAGLKVWGLKDEKGNTLPTETKELKVEPCKSNNIDWDGTGGDEFLFFKPADEFRYDIERFYEKLMCIVDPYEIQGDYNSAMAKQLVISFEKCRGEGCKDEAIIDRWL